MLAELDAADELEAFEELAELEAADELEDLYVLEEIGAVDELILSITLSTALELAFSVIEAEYELETLSEKLYVSKELSAEKLDEPEVFSSKDELLCELSGGKPSMRCSVQPVSNTAAVKNARIPYLIFCITTTPDQIKNYFYAIIVAYSKRFVK